MAMAESIGQLFLDHFHARREEPAFRQRRGYRAETFTYGAILDLAARFAHDLDARGIRKGDRVMVWGRNCAEWVATFFGSALRGVIVVPMDDGASADFALRVCRQVEAKLVLASREHSKSAKLRVCRFRS